MGSDSSKFLVDGSQIFFFSFSLLRSSLPLMVVKY